MTATILHTLSVISLMLSPSRQTLRDRVPGALAILGATFVIVAFTSNMIGLTHGPVDKARWMLGSVGVLLLCVGFFGRRVVDTYKWIVLSIANAVLLLVVLEIGATLIHRLTPSPPPPKMAEIREVHETSVARQLYVGWRGKAFSGEAINVGDDGRRVTLPVLPPTDVPPIRIFAFGGSTMWGECASDDETIPAYLQKLLNAEQNTNSRPVEVANFGQRAWVSTQSLIELTLQLQHGNVPDVVVFYDGYNETTAAYSTGRIGVPENYEGLTEFRNVHIKAATRWAKRTDLGRLLTPSRRGKPAPIDAQNVAADIVKSYVSVHRLVRALGEAHGFDVHFYWQPQLVGDPKTLTPEEHEIVENHPWLPSPVKELAAATYNLAATAADETDGITDISDAFVGMTERVYVDPCHILAAGNRRVAERMLAADLAASVIRRRGNHGINSE